ncbi:DMT family transporter [Aliishimia ponticola]|uniref:DMT family transporter n=1 Tax=Aliishimia ponticola TaxID=2499833 RepID=A0A4V3XK71_9RHOB|nr:DMT family transporter [Aliishimia ponticola]THH35823.1 DMT family transporter [Aliishimia ponticola]
MIPDRPRFIGVLVILGAGWGFTQPMTKIAVSEGYGHFGLIFWQLAIGSALMALIAALRGIRLPLRPRHLKLYCIIAMIGTVLPNSLSYQAAVHLPAGIVSILLSMIPMLAFPIALALRLDRFDWLRLAGLLVGLGGVLLIVAPGADLNGALPIFWVGAVLLTCAFYAFEGNYVARWGTEGLSPLQVLFGASLVGMIIAGPLAWGSGQWIDPRAPWGAPDAALVASSIAHVLVYTGYVWLVGQAGPVFSAQVSYLVTLFGLFWARLFLGESYAPSVWLALGLLVLGMYLVQPRPHRDTVDAA